HGEHHFAVKSTSVTPGAVAVVSNPARSRSGIESVMPVKVSTTGNMTAKCDRLRPCGARRPSGALTVRDGSPRPRDDVARPASARSARSPRLVQRSARVALRGDGTLTLACVADTHSQPHPATAERLAAIAPDAILHGGDIGDPAVIDQL